MCGPSEHPDFFAAVAEVWAQFPEESQEYAVAGLCLHKKILEIDFAKQVGVTSVENGRLVTRFVGRSDVKPPDSEDEPQCCKWAPVGVGQLSHHCLEICEV